MLTGCIALIIEMMLEFGVLGLLVKILSYCFKFAFSWRLVLGLWILAIIFRWLFVNK